MLSGQPKKEALYVLKHSPYGDGQQLVLSVTDTFRKGYICFDDTNRGHMIQGKITEKTDHSFTLCDINQDKWEFEEVTIEMFQKELYRFVENGEYIKNICKTTEELWAYFNGSR